jgi:hypothetical protein
MRITRTFVIAGVAASAIAGVAAAAALNTHTLTVRLPDGGVERIIYTGNVAPRVEVAPVTASVPVMWSGVPGFDDTAFAAMDRISAQMDREMAAMVRQADALGSGALVDPGAVTFASTAGLPAGAQSFSFVSTMSGGGVCSRSVEITSTGEGQKPRVVSHASGNCGGSSAAPTVSQSLDAAPAPTPDRTRLVETSYHPARRNSVSNGPA